MVAFQNYTFLEWCNVASVLISYCLQSTNAVHNNFERNEDNKLCIKLIISTCKKLSGLVRQGDLGHHHPLLWPPLKFQERPANRSQFSRSSLILGRSCPDKV